MFYKVEFDIEDFKAWAGGLNTKNDIQNANKEEEFNDFIEGYFDDDNIPTETEVNDFLWFERDVIYEALELDEDGRLVEDEDEE